MSRALVISRSFSSGDIGDMDHVQRLADAGRGAVRAPADDDLSSLKHQVADAAASTASRSACWSRPIVRLPRFTAALPAARAGVPPADPHLPREAC
jgi:hypothetical protein